VNSIKCQLLESVILIGSVIDNLTVVLGTAAVDGPRLYKQIPGGVPQFVLNFYHTWSSPTYGSGFSSPKITVNHQSNSDYRLIINNVEEGDSAVYYCHTWDDSAKEYVSQ
uniref:Immunoglobulin V-set domain-containing protein n=1 Tax=Seriola dumerili TaxID=41447 RepID=A0A3B4UG23_SERDU